LLKVDILNPSRSKKLFTLFNNHLKSQYVDYREDQVEGEKKNNLRRSRQAEMIGTIVKDRTRPDSRYIILGDMNNPPDSQYLRGFVRDSELKLTNALTNPKETRYELYDQIWLSPALSEKQTEAWIDRRELHGGDGSDHDPAWVKIILDYRLEKDST
jgi:exonuclease III